MEPKDEERCWTRGAASESSEFWLRKSATDREGRRVVMRREEG